MRIAAALLAIVGVGLILVPRPAVDNSLESWVDAATPEGAAYAAFSARFGTDDVVVVQVEGEDLEATLRFAARVEETLGADPTIEATLGPLTGFDSVFDVLLDPDLGGFAELERLRPRFAGPLNQSLGLVDLAQKRARVFALGRPTAPQRRATLITRIAALRAEAAARGLTFAAAGHPLLNVALDDAGAAVERQGMPLLIGLCVALLLISTRAPCLTAAALIPVAFGVLGSEGAYALFGLPTNIVVNIAKPLLFVVILASAMHVVVAFQDRQRAGEDRRTAAASAARIKARGVILALGTTAVGFGSLGLSDLLPIRNFGLLTAGGLLFAMPLVLVLLPTVLGLIGGRAGRAGESPLARLAVALVEFGARHRLVLVTLALAGVGAGAYAATTLSTEPHAIRYFATDQPVRADHDRIEASGMGLFTVECVFSGPGTSDPRTLEALDRFAAAARAEPGVLARADLPLLIREAGFRAAGQPDWPADPVVTDALAAEGPLRQFRAGDAVRVSLVIETLDASQLDALRARLTALAAAHVPQLALSVTGSYPLLLRAQRTLLHTLWYSLLTTAILMELVLLLAVRSPRIALAALLPNALPVALNFVAMAALGVPLDVGTSMTAAVALGIAVDDTLHFIAAWRPDDPAATARSTGRAIVLSSLVIGLGFLVLLTADFAPTRRFAGLCSFAMLTALLADLLLLPGLLARRPRRDAARPDG